MPDRRLSPFRVAFVYVGVTSLLLVLFDVVLPGVLANERLLVRIQALKEAVGIGLTGVFVFLILRTQQRTLERTNEELDEANRLLGILFRVLRHDLRNDTNVIRGYTRLLQASSSDDRQQEYLNHIDDAVTDIIDYSTKIQQMATSDTARTTVELPRVVDYSVEDLRSTHPEATITTEFRGVGRVRANPDVDDAIAEVVENAIVHNDSATPRVEVQLADAGDWWRVTVRDNGPGIPEHEREVLRRGEETPHVHSSGVGLWFVYWVVTNSNGRIDIADNDPRGSVVTLTLPKAQTGPSPTERRFNRLFQRNSG